VFSVVDATFGGQNCHKLRFLAEKNAFFCFCHRVLTEERKEWGYFIVRSVELALYEASRVATTEIRGTMGGLYDCA